MKVILLNDTSSWYHWGCTGTSTALKEQVQKLGFELISVPINETYNCKNTPETSTDFENQDTFNNFCKSNSSLIEQIKSAEIVIINGEGTIHALSHGARTLLYIAYFSKVYLKKTTQIINHSVYPQDSLVLDDPATIKLYQMVYQCVDFVAVREQLSADLMKRLGISITQSFDCLPLFIRDHYTRPKKSGLKNLLIAGSGAWFKEGLFEQFKPGLDQLVQYLNKMISEGFTVKVLIGAQAYPARDDQEFVSYLNESKINMLELIDAKNMEEWLDTIADASLLVSGRFHHTIAAACLGTPYITFKSNTPKVDAILEMFGTYTTLSYNSSDLMSELNIRTEKVLKNPETCFSKFSIADLYKLSEANFVGLKTLEHQKIKSQDSQSAYISTYANLFQEASSSNLSQVGIKEETLPNLKKVEGPNL